ncbi:MAG: RHS repeat protein, partial [Chloroflexota bacterium]|nr:RHS repeat protein [Chloroflexota bacterium]
QTMNYLQWATTITDANNHQRQSLADAFGRVVTVKEFNAGQTYTTDYAYNILNQLWQVQDAASPRNTTTMAYDKLGRKTAMTDPDLGTWSYAYDNVGNLTRQTDAKQQTTCLYYDALNRLKGKNYQSGTTCPSDPGSGYAVAYTYDTGANAKGRRTSMSVTGVTTTTWGYDLQGRTTSQTDVIDAASFTSYWTYDAMDRVRTMTYPVDDETVTTTYNTQGLPATLSGSNNYVTASNYNPASQLTSLAFGNGVTTNYTYNSQNLRLTQLTTSGVLQNLQYQYDDVGNIRTITDTIRSEISNFVYDDLDRLTNVTGAYTQGWVYNPIGNITSRTGVDAATFTYGDAAHKHAVTQVGSTTYAYDPNGNMTSRAGQTLQYDAENRLTQVISGTVTTQYVYNGDGARVKKTVNGVTTYYVGNWYEVTNGAATEYYYFAAQRVAMKQGSTVTYLLGDHLGSTSVAVDASGALQSRQTYYAFGGMRTSDVAPITSITDYNYTGQKLDSDGLMYYNARYYDATIGRFAQADTIVPDQFNPQSLNRYAYVRNNPVRYTDPTGYCEGDPDDPDDRCWREVRHIEHDFDGVHIDPAGWTAGELQTIYKALNRFSSAVGGVEAAMNAIGGVTFAVNNGEWRDSQGQLYAGTVKELIRLPHAHFQQQGLRQGVGPEIGIVHELAHYWDWKTGDLVSQFLNAPGWIVTQMATQGYLCGVYCEKGPTGYGRKNPQEQWAESVAAWVYPEYIDIIRAEPDPFGAEGLGLPAGRGGPGLGGLHVSFVIRQIYQLGGWRR